MFEVGMTVQIKSENYTEEYQGWFGKIAKIDPHADEGDFFGVELSLEPWHTLYFRANEIVQVPADAEEKDRKAWEADMADMAQIKKEWHDYRHRGDETPPTPPSMLR